MNYLREHQLDLMLVLIGICLILAVITFMTRIPSARRKTLLMSIELGAMFLLVFDRFAYLYRGDLTSTGFWMVRISNFMVFFLILFLEIAFILYLIDLYTNEGGLEKAPLRLKAGLIIAAVGVLLVVISQFTGLYYTFDEYNCYQRSEPGYYICYAIPLIVFLLSFSVIVQYYNKLSKNISLSLLLFTIVPIAASVAQMFLYGLSLNNIAVVLVAIILYIFALLDMNETISRANRLEVEFLTNKQKEMRELFEQAAEALASAIDAKDKYTHGHSSRVADYSRKIAELAGLDDDMCDKVYYAALLHDVGKIGVPDRIINKDGKLDDEEFAWIKKHPLIGNEILSRISRSPYLSIGAHHHHERYDGKGYPDRLKGDDIPEIARIIAVADAYDAMTSKRSYRDPIPHDQVREEIVKGAGTQFDPEFAKLMLHLIDLDVEYEMKDRGEIRELAGKNTLNCREYKEDISEGILISSNITKITLKAKPSANYRGKQYIPSLILFDSLDGRVQRSEKEIEDMLYVEYAEVRLDGKTVKHNARKIITERSGYESMDNLNLEKIYAKGQRYEIEAVRYRDHIQIKITNSFGSVQVTIALSDVTRYAYLSLTGEHCHIWNVTVDKETEEIGPEDIPRIAEEISYINAPAGDIPNVQVEGWCAALSESIPVRDGMKISFHSMSFPTARLIWHCPYIKLFTSENGSTGDPDHRDLVLIRFDGEDWESDKNVDNKIFIQKDETFTGWDSWRALNKKGMDCDVFITQKENVITVRTKNGGIDIVSITTITGEFGSVYAALTGDQVALTNIRIK